MKKILLFLISVVFVFTLCACGEDESAQVDKRELDYEAEREAYEADLERDAYEEKLAEYPDAIEWSDAENHVGEYVTIYGTVMDVDSTSSNGDPTFVDVGGTYPNDRLTGVIWEEYSNVFPDIHSINGCTVFMTGTIYMYDGIPNIELTDASQIDTLESGYSSDGEIGDYSLDDDTGISYDY